MSSRLFQKPTFRVATLLCLALAPAILVVPGCGGGSSGSSNSRPNFISRAVGTVSLNNGQSGTLDFRIDTSGRAIGTFTIANTANPADIKATQTSFRVGEYTVGGFYNAEENTLTLTGTVSGTGLVTIPVNVPTTESTGSFTVTLGGQTFGPATFSTFVTPTPRPTVAPTATATPRG